VPTCELVDLRLLHHVLSHQAQATPEFTKYIVSASAQFQEYCHWCSLTPSSNLQATFKSQIQLLAPSTENTSQILVTGCLPSRFCYSRKTCKISVVTYQARVKTFKDGDDTYMQALCTPWPKAKSPAIPTAIISWHQGDIRFQGII
jgi:hypothetical protein